MVGFETYILRWLPQPVERIYIKHRDIFRFIIIGGLATVVHYVTALITHYVVGLSPLWANFIAFCAAFNVTYIGNYFWVFKADTKHKTALPKSLTVSLTGLSVGQIIIWALTEKLGTAFHLTLIAVIMLVPILTFTLNRFWVFEKTT